jgi:hypothetical protein
MSSFVIICQQPEDSAMFQNLSWDSVGFHEVPWDSMRFCRIPWSSMRFYDIPVNQSVLTEVNRDLTSYVCQGVDLVIQRNDVAQF